MQTLEEEWEAKVLADNGNPPDYTILGLAKNLENELLMNTYVMLGGYSQR